MPWAAGANMITASEVLRSRPALLAAGGRGFCVAFIEFWRGVLLLTMVFIDAAMLALFLPEGASLDRLVRAMAALTLSTSAYMAEVVRGGLQGAPGGQAKAACSLGPGYWQVRGLAALAQASRNLLPPCHRERPDQRHHARRHRRHH